MQHLTSQGFRSGTNINSLSNSLGTLFYRKIVASQDESQKRSVFIKQLWEQTKDVALYPLLAEVSAETQQAEELLQYLDHVHQMKNLTYS